MSTAGIEMKKEALKNYISFHPDSRMATIEGSEVSFPVLFDYIVQANNDGGGNAEQQKRVPHISFSSEYSSLLVPRTTKINLEGVSKPFTVYYLRADKANSTFLAEAWLI